jgi:hypothetical protein
MLGAQMRGWGHIGGMEGESIDRTAMETGSGLRKHRSDRRAANGSMDCVLVGGNIGIAAFGHTNAVEVGMLDSIGMRHRDRHGDQDEQQGQQHWVKSCSHSISGHGSGRSANQRHPSDKFDWIATGSDARSLRLDAICTEDQGACTSPTFRGADGRLLLL